jgi:predicted AAA+ superfamily ATPase
MLPVLPRIPEITELIKGDNYFIIHAPRQSGKTTLLKSLTATINSTGEYHALYCSLEALEGVKGRNSGIIEIENQIFTALLEEDYVDSEKFIEEYRSFPPLTSTTKIKYFLHYICTKLDKPLIIFFDETDRVSEKPLITFLRQIRLGYINRYDRTDKLSFPSSISLIGMRDIRDYLTKTRPESDSKQLASPFNIKKKTLILANFTYEEIKSLYSQHTNASGQLFKDSVFDRAWYWTEGQPWMVNALAYEAICEILKNDYSMAVTGEIIDQAATVLSNRRDTHIDSLRERLKEPRVARVMDSVFAGTMSYKSVTDEDRRLCIDLGLVVVNEKKYCVRLTPCIEM